METDDELLNTTFTFQLRATPLPCDLRPVWRLAVLLLILQQCRDRKATIEQLHVMNWAIRNPDSQKDFIGFLNGSIAPSQVIVRHDPSLTRAIDFALAEEVVSDQDASGPTKPKQSKNYRIWMTDRGAAIADEIMKDETCFVREKNFLLATGPKVTQASIQQLFDGSRNEWA